MVLNEDVEVRIRTRKRQVEENSEIIQRIVDSLVSKYSREIDEYMVKTKELLEKAGDAEGLTDLELEDITLRVPVYMYFAGEGLEILGVQGDNAKAVRQDVFNRIYLETHGTIKDKEHSAEVGTLSEFILETAFSRAYKMVKTKLDNASLVAQAARKIVGKRTQELGITRMLEPGNVRGTGSERKGIY